MKIAPGSFFIVTRGFRYGGNALSFFGSTGETYDRSDSGKVFRADSVCGPSIVATCILATEHFGSRDECVGQQVHLNALEVVVEPITQAHFDAMRQIDGAAVMPGAWVIPEPGQVA